MGQRVEGHRNARAVMRRVDLTRVARDRMDRRGMNLVGGDSARMTVASTTRRRMDLMAVDLVRMMAV
jgi:ABC-type phosphate transport system ATPase subunit